MAHFAPILAAVRYAFSILGGHINRLFLTVFGSHARHDLGKDTPPTLSLSAIVQILVRVVFLRGMAPSSVIAVNEDNSAQDASAIGRWFAIGLLDMAFYKCHLQVTQSEKIAHVTTPFGGWSMPQIGNQQVWILSRLRILN